MSAPGPASTLARAAFAGSVASLLCAAGWGAILGFWGLRSTILGVSLGIFVGLAIRVFGRRSDFRVLLLGGGMSAWSCLLGNVAGFTIAAARARGLSAAEAIVILGSHGGTFLLEDAMTPINLLSCLFAGIAGAIVSKRGSEPEAVIGLLGAAGGAHVMPGTLGAPEASPAKLRPPPPGERTPVVEKRLPLRHASKKEGGEPRAS